MHTRIRTLPEAGFSFGADPEHCESTGLATFTGIPDPALGIEEGVFFAGREFVRFLHMIVF
jgi:hypothetical protein